MSDSTKNSARYYHKCTKFFMQSTRYYNDVSNQQDATTFLFIIFFNSALHVSGDKFAYPQEHFLTVYTAFGTMQRHCCRPVASISTVAPVGSSVGALYQKLYIQSKSSQFHLNRLIGRQQCRCIVPKAVYTVKKCTYGNHIVQPTRCTCFSNYLFL